MALLNRARMTTATTGTGTVTLGSAVTAHLTFAEAGAVNGAVYSYCIEDGNDFEIGIGTYTSSGTTFSRDTVTASKISGTAGTTKLTLSGSAQIFIDARVQDLREILTAARTYFVRTDGSNSNSGLANTSGGAFLTIQKAIDVVATIDLAGFAVTIQVAAGTYTGTILIDKPFFGGLVTLLGDAATPANCLISHSAFNSFLVTGNATAITVQGFKITNSAASSLGNGINVAQGASVTLSNIDFGSCTRYHIEIGYGGSVTMGANYSITAGAINHVDASACAIFTAISRTITLTGTPAFSTAFMNTSTGGQAVLFSNTWSGSATGSRYSAVSNSVINTFGAGATHLPGNAAGSTATGGQYL